MKWVTRERPKIDRIACPWLIQRFIEKEPEFLYVPADRVLATAKETGAIPYDIPNVKFSHVGDKCSFDAFIAEYKLDAPGLDTLADIVRGADTSRLDLTPQSSGLFAISLGLSHLYQDDHEMLRHGMVMYDALYAWCRSLVRRDPQLAAQDVRMPCLSSQRRRRARHLRQRARACCSKGRSSPPCSGSLRRTWSSMSS